MGKGAGNGSERNGRRQEGAISTIKCASASKVMPEGEDCPGAIDSRAPAEEGRRTAIDLAGAVIGFIARVYGEHEGWGHGI
jgi:hypothetical protein